MTKRILATCGFFAAAVFSAATPLIDTPVTDLTLANGEVLHDAQAKGFNPNSVLVRYRDGAKTIPYTQFPAEYRDALLAKKPAPPKSVPVAMPKTPAPQVAGMKKTPAGPADRLPEERYRGLAMLSSSVNGSTGTVELYNDTLEPVDLDPSCLLAETSNGKLVVGAHWVTTDNDGNPTGTLKGVQSIPPRSSATLTVNFAHIPMGASLTRLVWSQK